MNPLDQAVEVFLEAWAPELGRSIEMFRGEQPEVTWSLLAGNRAAEQFSGSGEVFWWRQPLESGGSFAVWIGAPAQTWGELTSGLGETAEDRRQMYLEMLGPSLQGAAHALSAGRSTRIICQEGSEPGEAPSGSLHLGAVQITLNGRALPVIVAGLEEAFAGLIAPAPAEESATQQPGAAPGGTGYETRLLFDRLIELELPISIVLGRAVLPIRDVLKLSAGSLVDLDRRVGDPVEIVVHNVVVARGEVVAVKGNYGVRVKEVISRKDRIALQQSARRGTTQASPA